MHRHQVRERLFGIEVSAAHAARANSHSTPSMRRSKDSAQAKRSLSTAPHDARVVAVTENVQPERLDVGSRISSTDAMAIADHASNTSYTIPTPQTPILWVGSGSATSSMLRLGVDKPAHRFGQLAFILEAEHVQKLVVLRKDVGAKVHCDFRAGAGDDPVIQQCRLERGGRVATVDCDAAREADEDAGLVDDRAVEHRGPIVVPHQVFH